MFDRGIAFAAGIVVLALATPGAALAWADEGHEVVGTLAYQRLTPAAKRAVDALLAKDKDALTKPDFVSRTTWADKYRDSDRDTTKVHYNATHMWHFVDIEIDNGTLAAACNNHPALPAGTPASQGPANACVVDKIEQFRNELADKSTPTAERILALKFLMHFVGDLHQPLHAADHHDGGGNAVPVLYAHLSKPDNLHAYWDRQLVLEAGATVQAAAQNVAKLITADKVKAWSAGSVEDWANESYAHAKDTAYNFSGEKSFVDDHGGTGETLDAKYDARALPVAKEALAKAGVRLANLLNEVFK